MGQAYVQFISLQILYDCFKDLVTKSQPALISAFAGNFVNKKLHREYTVVCIYNIYHLSIVQCTVTYSGNSTEVEQAK